MRSFIVLSVAFALVVSVMSERQAYKARDANAAEMTGKYGRQAAARNLAAKSDNKARFAQQQDAVAEYAGSHQSRSLESEAEAGINARSASAQAESAKNARGAAKGTADLTAALRDLTQHAERGLASVSETYNKATRSLREMAKEMFAKMN